MSLRILSLATILLLFSTTSYGAGKFPISAEDFYPCTDVIGSTATSTFTHETGKQPHWSWQFDGDEDHCAYAHFHIPPATDMIGVTCTPTIEYRLVSGGGSSKAIYWAMGITANVGLLAPAQYDQITGFEGDTFPLTSSSTTGLLANRSYETALPPVTIYMASPSIGVCTPGDCNDKLGVMVLERVVDNTHCLSSGFPWDCCTGAATGTCATDDDFTNNVQVLGVRMTCN